MSTKINNYDSNIRKANMIFNKNGNGYDTTRITIPVTWAKKLGFSEKEKDGFLILDNDKIVLKKYNSDI